MYVPKSVRTNCSRFRNHRDSKSAFANKIPFHHWRDRLLYERFVRCRLPLDVTHLFLHLIHHRGRFADSSFRVFVLLPHAFSYSHIGVSCSSKVCYCYACPLHESSSAEERSRRRILRSVALTDDDTTSETLVVRYWLSIQRFSQ